jgi:hypothetical protein
VPAALLAAYVYLAAIRGRCAGFYRARVAGWQGWFDAVDAISPFHQVVGPFDLELRAFVDFIKLAVSEDCRSLLLRACHEPLERHIERQHDGAPHRAPLEDFEKQRRERRQIARIVFTR